MDRWAGKVAVVPGASTEIGSKIILQLVKEGLKVVGLAKEEYILAKYKEFTDGQKGEFYGLKSDVTKGEEIAKAFAWIKKEVGPIHILVNCAGKFRNIDMLDLSSEDAKAVLGLNILSPTLYAGEALKAFKENNINGHIININCMAAPSIEGFPGQGLYVVAKDATTTLSKVLVMEIHRMRMGTKVTSISAGPIKLELKPHALREKVEPEKFLVTPEAIINAVMYVLATPPHCQIDEIILRPIQVKQ